MKFAGILSDLTSLRACDPKDALALVNITTEISKTPEDSLSGKEDDPKFLLAKQFLELSSQQHDNQELEEKRKVVEEILRMKNGTSIQRTPSL